MSKGSVGLGLATRQMSLSSSQDRKQGRSSYGFLALSLTLILCNVFANDLTSVAKHHFADQTVVITEVVSKPIATITEKIQSVKLLLDVQSNNEMLMAENKKLLEWYQTANRLDAENKALRDLLKMNADEAVSYKSAKVISDASTQYSHTILVRSGQSDGLNKGQGVLSQEGLIGRIIETGNNTSRILLMSDVNSRIPVTVEGTQDRAILAGTNNGDPVLDHLPETHSVKVGQKIITSGHGGIFPYGVPVGETYVDSDGNMAVRPFADPNRANYVQIVDYGVPAGSTSRATASNNTSILR